MLGYSFNEKLYKGAWDNRLARSKNAMAARIVLVALLMVGLQRNYLNFSRQRTSDIAHLSKMWMMRVLANNVISVRRGKTTP